MRANYQETSVRQVLALLIAASVLMAISSTILFIIGPDNLPILIGALASILFWLGILVVNRRGHIQTVKWLITVLLFSIYMVGITLTGGLNSPYFFGLIEAIIITTILFGLEGAIVTIVLSLAAGIVFLYTRIPPHLYSLNELMVIHFSNFLVISLFFYFSYRWLHQELTLNVELKEKLDVSESRMKDLVMNLPLSAMVIRLDDSVELINERMTEVLGYTREDLLTVDDWFSRAYVDPELASQRSRYWHTNAFRTDKRLVSTEVQVFTKDKKLVDLEVYANYLGDKAIVLLNDITRRKAAERALLASEEKFRAIIEQASEAITLIDEEGRIIEVNKAGENLNGLSRGELIGSYYWDTVVKLLPPEMRTPQRVERNKQVIMEALQTGKSPAMGQPIEITIFHKDGEKRNALMTAFLIHLEQRNCIASISLDITDKKHAEEVLAEQRAKLLEAERNPRKTLETIETISCDLRLAENKTGFYRILLEKCTNLLRAESSRIYESLDGKFVISMHQGVEVPEQNGITNKMALWLTDFSTGSQSVSFLEDPVCRRQVGLVKLFTNDQVFGYLVLAWQNDQKPEDIHTILQTVAEFGGIALDRMRVLETLEERVRTRTRELLVLYEMMQVYVSNEDILYVIKESLRIFLNTILADSCVFYLAEQGGAQFRLINLSGSSKEVVKEGQLDDLRERGWGQVLSGDKPVLLMKALYPFDSPDHDARSTSFIGVPVRSNKGLLAVAGFLYDRELNLSLEVLNLINLFADQIGMVIERNILRQQVKITAVIEERERLSRELHDSLTQSLYSLKLLSDAAKRLSKQQKWDEVENQLNPISEIATQALKELRFLIYELVPESIEQLGLVVALEQRLNFVERRSGITVEFIHEGNLDLPRDVQVNLFRIAQEALNNVAKHASATKIEVHLACSPQQLSLLIKDNGKGFDPAGITPGMGLKNMRDRAQQIGGTIKIESEPGLGTQILYTGYYEQ
jgi:PAS domain S-box-containing protein